MILDAWMGFLLLAIVVLCGINHLAQKLQARSDRILGVLETPLDAEAEAEDLAQAPEYFLRTVHPIPSRGWWLGLRYFRGGVWDQAAVFIPCGHPAETEVRYRRVNRLRLVFRRLPDANPRQVASYLHMDVISYKT